MSTWKFRSINDMILSLIPLLNGHPPLYWKKEKKT